MGIDVSGVSFELGPSRPFGLRSRFRCSRQPDAIRSQDIRFWSCSCFSFLGPFGLGTQPRRIESFFCLRRERMAEPRFSPAFNFLILVTAVAAVENPPCTYEPAETILRESSTGFQFSSPLQFPLLNLSAMIGL